MKSVAIIAALFFTYIATAFGAGSSSYTPSVKPEIREYNKGVSLMMKKQFSKAEDRFRRALEKNEQFAEAHNNLAYVLRKQGPEHYDEALTHYNRAIELNSGLPEPYMYRGVLYMQMNLTEQAEQDYRTLSRMDAALASELRYVIENGMEKQPEQFFGVSGKLN